ncbi:MAG: DUF222 domain-containing protein [Actinobacteria bacterium]|nr:DUF222 domain-containing protein [Actinomycetota bacterium]
MLSTAFGAPVARARATISAVVGEAVAALRELLADFEPATLDGHAARRLAESCAELERLTAACRTLAAGRVAATGTWATGGSHRDAGTWLAATLGTSVGQARAALETAERVAGLPETREALRAGRLSATQAELVSSAAVADPHAEAVLLASARRDGIKGLRDTCARVRAAACPDEHAQYRRIHAARSVRHWCDPDGTGRISVRGPVDRTAAVMASLEPFERQCFEENRKAGQRENGEANAFDALVLMSEHAVPCEGGECDASPPAVTTVVHLSHTAMERGHVERGEQCEIAGAGPVPVAVARALAADSFLKAVLADATDVRAISHLGRTIPARLRTAIETRDRECVIAGCHVNQHLEIDHNVPVSEGGRTELANLGRLCRYHHRQKTLGDLRLQGTPGTMQLVPADRAPP